MLERRRFLQGTLAAAVVGTPDQLQRAMLELFGERQPQRGKVTLDIPPLVENGSTVPLTVTVAAEERVARIHVLNEKNPQPHVITVTLGPNAGRAAFSTRIKLAASQRVVAIAEMADGTLWQGEQSVVVTIAACVEEGP
jgi:sulfur-oxidizing protein SoxY